MNSSQGGGSQGHLGDRPTARTGECTPPTGQCGQLATCAGGRRTGPEIAGGRRPAERAGAAAVNSELLAGSPRRSTGPGATWSAPTTPRASSTCTSTGCSARPAATPTRRAARCSASSACRSSRSPTRSSTSTSCCSGWCSTPQSPSAIAGAILGARAGARGIREVISSEMWECLNVTGARPRGPAAGRRAARSARVPAVHQGAGGAVLRPGGLHDEPRRRLAVPGPRPQPGAGRHDRPAAARAHVRARRTGLAGAAARLRRP